MKGKEQMIEEIMKILPEAPMDVVEFVFYFIIR